MEKETVREKMHRQSALKVAAENLGLSTNGDVVIVPLPIENNRINCGMIAPEVLPLFLWQKVYSLGQEAGVARLRADLCNMLRD